ncbi:MAG: nucleoside phosphorylase [bacterium]|nr:nucleoside phosphorylase [bacterium]
MKILVLEDDSTKSELVKAEISSVDLAVSVEIVSNLRDYTIKVGQNVYDLIIVDLVVPQFPFDAQAIDVTGQIIDITRDQDCLNFRSPVLALTRYNEKAEAQFEDLNRKDITIVTFDEDSGRWKESIREKVRSCEPPVHYPFVIICALAKEADAYAAAGYQVGERQTIKGLACREISIGLVVGVIITAPRMGLVSSAITSTQAIEAFKPKLICMSGICGGVPEKTKIYDVVIPDICHQNDSGKWTNAGFESEGYSVQLEHGMKLKIDELISKPAFLETVKRDVILRRAEFPEGADVLDFKIIIAPTSSGSAVIADKEMVEILKEQHRKLSAFEMESFAVFEAARLAPTKPQYFSAKAVVDDGSPSKGDLFHRVACILSAKVVYECIKSGLLLSGGVSLETKRGNIS